MLAKQRYQYVSKNYLKVSSKLQLIELNTHRRPVLSSGRYFVYKMHNRLVQELRLFKIP